MFTGIRTLRRRNESQTPSLRLLPNITDNAQNDITDNAENDRIGYVDEVKPGISTVSKRDLREERAVAALKQ